MEERRQRGKELIYLTHQPVNHLKDEKAAFIKDCKFGLITQPGP